MVAVKQHGIRPPRPSDDRCYTRGLTDEIWDLMNECWATEASERPSACQIVTRLRALPNRSAVDYRPPDDHDMLFPALILHQQIDYPFSTVVNTI